ncbi:doublecortin domain-containing protein 1 [Macrotis lagotis]|uniref:doublecortin domain-containing protein 1 n=1 Tax=Macrotis lagotis TaxID=92651 RepID=UPI003D686087
MYKTESLILGPHGAVVAGARVVVSKSEIWKEEESLKDLKEKQEEKIASKTTSFSGILDSQAKDIVSCQKHHRIAWQQTASNSEDDLEEEKLFKNMESFKRVSNRLKPAILQKACHQQFEFKDGHIFNTSIPNLVLGVQRFNLQSGSGVILVKKNSYDKHQKWIYKEESRTFHLMRNPNLVLAVDMNTGPTEDAAKTTSYPVIVQRYMPYCNGSANQKWHYMKCKKVIKAFYSTKMDIEITIANHTGVCTATVTKEKEIDQIGYYFYPTDSKTKIMICLACSRSMANQKDLKKLLPGSKFFCSFDSKEQKQLSRNSKADLSSGENESLRHYEELLLYFQQRGSTQPLSHNILAAMRQTPVKIIAHKNGTRSANGKLIVAQSFLMLLSECTTQLGLTRAASRLYTWDGTTILNLNDLIVWAVNDFLKHKDSGEKKNLPPEENKDMSVQSIEDKKTNQGEIKSSLQSTMSSLQSTMSSLQSTMSPRLPPFNASLLSLILKNPIEVWVSSGESFIPLDALKRSEKLERKNWLAKDRILADLDIMKHKMRQLKGRRVFEGKPGKIIFTNTPSRRMVVMGNWMEPTQEERKLLKYIVNAKAHLSEVQKQQTKRNSSVSTKKTSLYIQPNTKRVLAYLNGHENEDGVYVWGRSVAELLDACSLRLRMMFPAKTMYTLDGKPLTSWNDIKKDMVICVSAGNHYINYKEIKRQVAIRANYAQVRKLKGPHATHIVSTTEMPQSKGKNLFVHFRTNDDN